MTIEKTVFNTNKVSLYSSGDVLKILYLQRITKFRRIFSFTGICTIINNKTKNFTIQNYYGPEYVKLSFLYFSPNIIFINLIKSYNFKFKHKKLFTIKKLHLKNRTDKIFFLPKTTTLTKAETHLYKTGYLDTKEKKRLRNKFRI